MNNEKQVVVLSQWHDWPVQKYQWVIEASTPNYNIGSWIDNLIHKIGAGNPTIPKGSWEGCDCHALNCLTKLVIIF